MLSYIIRTHSWRMLHHSAKYMFYAIFIQNIYQKRAYMWNNFIHFKLRKCMYMYIKCDTPFRDERRRRRWPRIKNLDYITYVLWWCGAGVCLRMVIFFAAQTSHRAALINDTHTKLIFSSLRCTWSVLLMLAAMCSSICKALAHQHKICNGTWHLKSA